MTLLQRWITGLEGVLDSLAKRLTVDKKDKWNFNPFVFLLFLGLAITVTFLDVLDEEVRKVQKSIEKLRSAFILYVFQERK